jgi:hypothetical protein
MRISPATAMILFLTGCQMTLPPFLSNRIPKVSEVCGMREPERSTMIARLNMTADDLALACLLLDK